MFGHGRRAEARLDPIRWRWPGRIMLVRLVAVAALLGTAAAVAWSRPPGCAPPAAAPGAQDRADEGAGRAEAGAGQPGRDADPTGQDATNSGTRDPGAANAGQDARTASQDAGRADQDAGPGGQNAGSAGQDAGSAGQNAGSAGQNAGPAGRDATNTDPADPGARDAGPVGGNSAGTDNPSGPGTDARPVVPAGLVGVPVRLGEPAALALVRAGDRVDLVSVDNANGHSTVIAEAALVLVVSGASDPTAGGLLLALRPAEARRAVGAPERAHFAVLVRP